MPCVTGERREMRGKSRKDCCSTPNLGQKIMTKTQTPDIYCIQFKHPPGPPTKISDGRPSNKNQQRKMMRRWCAACDYRSIHQQTKPSNYLEETIY